MGYACPVCETPQADGRHLANHIAFTAMIHGDDHEAWLTEHTPGWEEKGEHELAKRVVESATEVEFPPGPEAASEHEGSGSHDHSEHEHDDGHSHDHGGGRNDRADRRPEAGSSAVAIGTDVGSGGENDRDVAAVVAEARELTRRMRDRSDSAEDNEERAPNQGDEPDREEDETEADVEDGNQSDGRKE